jgi:ferric-dicitrate binding protein FerR (iron transport regulator)
MVASMAAKDSIGKAGAAARKAQRNRYIQRLIEDEELRGNLLTAYGAARGVYGRMSNGKPASKALFEDKKLQRELREAAKALREASNALSESPKKSRRRRKGGLGRALLLLTVAATLALVLSEDLRSKVLDMLFGAEEEFDYSSTTAPAEPAPAPVATPAA